MAEQQQEQGNIKPEYTSAVTGLDMDKIASQIPKGKLSYAMNAAVENFDSNTVSYQNEPGNEFCLQFPDEYQLIGKYLISEQNKHIFFLCNPITNGSEIGYMENNDCIYHTLVNSPCLNFNIQHPVHKVVHKITNCTTEIYWTDGLNPRRYLDLQNLPYKLASGSPLCDPVYSSEIDCNQIKIQPNFEIPELSVAEVLTGGDIQAGVYQFAIQYSNANSSPYSSFYSITNPVPVANPKVITTNFNYEVGKSIILNIKNLDTTGYFQYFNIAVIKTINGISSVELVGTYFIDNAEKNITYTGQNKTQSALSMSDIFEKYPYYDIAEDVTTVQDILVWDNLTSIDRINYQQIANQITLQWQTYRIPNTETYANEINATNFREYMRDEVYSFEIAFILKNGKQTDGFHIPGRKISPYELGLPDIPTTNPDFVGNPDYKIGTTGYSKYWKIYNTASVTGTHPGYTTDPSYKGAYQYGEFAYWESTETYPCNSDVWGELVDKPIRHHKFPDVLVSPIFESAVPQIIAGKYSVTMQTADAIFPIGVNIDIQQLTQLITNSNLTQDQKDNIAAFKILRGDRTTNKSIVAKGILRNVGKYNRDGTPYYYANYPYNDLRSDPFLLTSSNAYTANAALAGGTGVVCRNFTILAKTDADVTVQYRDCSTNLLVSKNIPKGTSIDICCLDYPKPAIIAGTAFIVCNTYKRYKITAQGGYFRWTPANIIGNTTPTVPIGRPSWTYPDWHLPHGTPPAGYTTWIEYCVNNPTDGVCNSCLDPGLSTGYYSSQGIFITRFCNIGGADCGYSYYVDSLIPPYFTGTGSDQYTIDVVDEVGFTLCGDGPLEGYNYSDEGYRQIFNSPETSFRNPFIGNILKLENVLYGAGKAHFVEVKKNSLHKLLTGEAQLDAVVNAGNIAGMVFPFNATLFFSVYQAYITILINSINRRNYEWSFNSIANYDYSASIYNNFGIKQRPLDIAQYIIPGVQSVGDDHNINNYQRESSVYLKTSSLTTPLPNPDKTPDLASGTGSLILDNSRFTLSDKDVTTGLIRGDCFNPGNQVDINVVSYYASIKNDFINQWGQIYSYNTIDTGFQQNIESQSASPSIFTIFGGDTFINKFSFKTKLPFFIDNRVGAPDDSDIFFDEIGNIAYPKYWYSSRSVFANANVSSFTLTNFVSFKAHNLDCPNSQDKELVVGVPNPGRMIYDGKMYLFAYGIPTFYCESGINVDLRQAFNDKDGEFFPHVSTGIPDDWVQESFVSIAFDNTYYYNSSYSKQNTENFFSHLPPDWKSQLCYTNFPFKAIYSDPQSTDPTNRVNSWLSYGATSNFDFPQNFGKLISLDGIQNKAILARFENKSLLYNTMLTIETSNPQAAYLGNSTLFKSSPPIDFAETDLGYVGTQHKFLLKVPQGQITIDAKRGQIFLIDKSIYRHYQANDLSKFGSGVNRFFTDHLAFEILRYFPDVDIDNHFNGLGLHGVYDSKFDRIIISKLDYIPISKDVKYDSVSKEFYVDKVFITGTTYPYTSTTSTSSTSSTTSTSTTIFPTSTVREIIYLTDENYFCNKSWTISYNINTQSWISFHSYIPNWYIAENNFFYSGINGCCTDFDAIVGGEPQETTTTTSSSTSSTSTTTTSSTTIYAPICTLAGNSVQKDCAITGDAVQVSDVTTTTSTTLV